MSDRHIVSQFEVFLSNEKDTTNMAILSKVALTATISALLLSPTNSFSLPSSHLTSTRSLTASKISINSYVKSQPNYVNTGNNGLKMASAAGIEDVPLFEKFLVGIRRDYKQRLPHYGSDIKDGLNTQCLAATAFLFFACLAPAIGFGALFGLVTNGAIGTMEMVSSTAVCGVIYALTSAQPLTIIGSTGPVLAFVESLVQFAKLANLPFLPLYAWTGIWTAGILFLLSLFSGSNGVKYLTRFTDEIFSVLISFIFVVEAVSDISKTFHHDVFSKALLTLLCASTTFVTATVLKSLRKTSYFTKSIRDNVSNFAPSMGVLAGALIARWARLVHGTATAGLPTLSMPHHFQTTSGRPWLVPIFDLPVWARYAAVLPALMATVLLYLDQNITVRLVNNPRYKMKKGRRKKNMLDGMNADLLVISLLTFFQSLVGFPWLVAATVRSISHVRALSELDENGKIKGTVEQRVTGFTIHSLISCCVLLEGPRQFLTNIPKSVLMGLFLYLGTSALPGNEMWERMKGLVKDKTAAKEKWDGVQKTVVNFYTIVQVACLGAMIWVKSSPIGVLFPVVIAMLAPLRFGLEKFGFIFKDEMAVLDSDE